MSKKKNVKKQTGIQIPKREAGKVTKTDYMRNLRPFPSGQQSHPVEELLGINNSQDFLDTQAFPIETPEIEASRQPNTNLLDTQNIKLNTPQNLQTGQPKNTPLDAQINNSEHPNTKLLGVKTPKKGIQTPKDSDALDAQTPSPEKLDTQKNQKNRYDYRKYEAARSTVRINLHIDREIDKKVRQYCLIDAHPKVDLKDFYERGALMLLEYLDTQKQKGLGVEAPLDDRRMKMLYKTKPFVINLYLAYNTIYNEIVGKSSPSRWKGKWTAKDDDLGRTYNDIDARIVELGILQTQTNKGFDINGSKIQTFKYYTDEIEKCIAADVGTETLDVVLNYHRQVWKKLTNREVDLSFLGNS
jgi:hypothetical protein